MPKVLTADDSSAIRTIVNKSLSEKGFEVVEAEDGEKALEKLAEGGFDLVLLDVSMPVMDGPTLLKAMRDRGDQTPVLMVTSEAKRSVIAEAMKNGLQDFILKPFKPEELEAKVNKVLGRSKSSETEEPEAEEKEPGDVLLIDAKEHVGKKLRTLVPEKVSLDVVASASDGLSKCRSVRYKLILCDNYIPDAKPSVLVGQLRGLQPEAAIAVMVLRNDPMTKDVAMSQGFNGVLLKPFDLDQLEDLLMKHFQIQEILEVTENICTVKPYTGREDRLKRYYATMRDLIQSQLPEVAAACYDHLILDFDGVPFEASHLDPLAPVLSDAREAARKMGLEFRVVGSEELRKAVAGNSRIASLPTFESLDAAKA